MQSSFKQRLLISSLIGQSSSESMIAIYKATPRNNQKHHDARVDYTEYILADNLEPLTTIQASIIIKTLLGKKDEFGRNPDRQKAYNHLISLDLINK